MSTIFLKGEVLLRMIGRHGYGARQVLQRSYGYIELVRMKQTQDLRTKLRARCDVLVVTIGQQRARESEKEKNKEKRERERETER